MHVRASQTLKGLYRYAQSKSYKAKLCTRFVLVSASQNLKGLYRCAQNKYVHQVQIKDLLPDATDAPKPLVFARDARKCKCITNLSRFVRAK